MRTISVKVQPDHLEKMTRGRRPVLALAELIWNGLDADATFITVNLERDFSEGVKTIRITDDGIGINPHDADSGFSNLGGSWKRVSTSTRREHRILHGKEGKGRFQAFALGTDVIWRSCFEDNGVLREIEISGSSDQLGTFRVSDPITNGCAHTGTEVQVTNVPEAFAGIPSKRVADELSEIFAFYLRQYPAVRIVYDGLKVDPSSIETHVADYGLGAVQVGDSIIHDAKLTIIEWSVPTSRSLYLCNADGFALHALAPGIKAPSFSFTAYLRSDYFRKLHEDNSLLVGDLDPGTDALHDTAKIWMREHFRRRAAEQANELVSQWKKENIYPYSGEPLSVVERTERQVFDVIALNVNSYLPDFSGSDERSKRFSLRLLKQAIESNPDSIQRILTDVLDLPKNKQDELAELLNKTSLAAIITASKVVADRLNFLRGLQVLVYEKAVKRQLLERRQLHRILADHTWIFGEEFNLSVDDESLTQVLKKHLKLLGREEIAPDPVKRQDGSDGIVDLMMSRAIPQPKSIEREHLVVELKRPTQKIDDSVITQIRSYDERFRDTNTKWVFWAISNEMDDLAEMEADQANRPRGLITDNEKKRIKIWVKTWGEVIQECESRLTFFQQQLNYTADRASALDYLKTTHARYFPPVLRDEIERLEAEESQS